MNILLFGESCTGKSTVAEALSKSLDMKVYTGKDYLRLAKNKADAIKLFRELLNNKESNIIFVATEKEEIHMFPKDMVKVLFTADLDTKKERFAKRFRGNLPKPVEKMIENKHGMFDEYDNDLSINQSNSLEQIVIEIKALI